MKHLLLAIVLTVFSYNSYAAGRCLISFEGAGKDNLNQKLLSKNNYQEADIMDIGEGDLLASVSEIKHDKALSNDDYQVISFIQTIERTYQHGRDLRLEVIHTKKIMTKLTTAEFIALDTPDMVELIGKLRSENLPSCVHR